jgi:cell division protein FtsQ
VFALRRGQGRRSLAGQANARVLAVEGVVLPRLLRRPARMLGRLAAGDFVPPRYCATAMTAALLAAAGIYGSILGGHGPAIVQAVTARSGFAVEEIKISGHREISEIDVLERLQLDGYTSLIGFDADAARERIAGLGWVESASVRKIYPDTLEVKIEERKPFAVWQHGRELMLIEESGNVIAPLSGSRHASLPLVVGLGAPERAAAFLAKVGKLPGLAARVKGYIRIAERRWDLRLENGITIKLPDHGEEAALADIVEMDRSQGLLTRDIAAVDLRLDDRLVIQLTPEAVVRRDAALKESAKKSKTERRI